MSDLCRRRGRADDQFSGVNRRGNVVGDQFRFCFVPAAEILDDDDAPRRPVCRDGLTVAAPEPDLMASQREITGRGERTISTTKYGDAHAACSCLS